MIISRVYSSSCYIILISDLRVLILYKHYLLSYQWKFFYYTECIMSHYFIHIINYNTANIADIICNFNFLLINRKK